jgi:hypothetical protein
MASLVVMDLLMGQMARDGIRNLLPKMEVASKTVNGSGLEVPDRKAGAVTPGPIEKDR